MRTKNAKRLWPVPVTLGVMALAALLAFGLMATTGAQPAAAQEDPCITIPNTGATTPAGDDCNVSGTSAVIKFTGLASGTDEFSFYVYGADVGDGNPVAYQPSTEYNAADGFHIVENIDGTNVPTQVEPLRFQLVEVDAPKNQGTGLAASSSTLTIAGEPGTSATLHVYRGGTGPTTSPISGAESVTGVKVALPTTGLTLITVKFLGPAAKGSATDRLSDIGVLPDTVPQSDGDPYALNQKVTLTSQTEIPVIAKVLDSAGNELDGKIVYNIEYVEGSSVEPGRSSFSTQPDDYPDDTTDADHFDATHDANPGVVTGHMVMVTGWETSGPVSVKVTADFIREGETSPSLKLGPVTISRAGDLDSVSGMTCVADMRPAAEQVKDDGCGMTMRPRSVFEPGGTFMIDPKSLDVLGTAITDPNSQPKVTLPDAKTDEGNAVMVSVAAVLDDANTTDIDEAVPAHYMIDEMAPPGSYDIVVKATQRKGGTTTTKDRTLTVIVSGPPVMYEITGPEYISLAAFSSGEYTIMATDAAGNPPAFDEGEDEVSVVLESSLSVRTTGLVEGVATLNAETGMDTFTIFKPAGAQQGDMANIGIFVGDDLMDTITVTFGEEIINVAPMASEEGIADQMAYAGGDAVMVDVSAAFSDADEGDTLTYSAMSSDDMIATASVDGSMVSIMGMAEGMATITVTAMDPDGETAMQTIDVTVMEAMLGAPSIDNAMSDAAGMATIILTPGDNATKHWVWAAPTDGSEGMWHGDSALAGDATMVTFSGLTSGMNYWFIAVAGRGTGTDSEWSDWSGWTAETPIQ